MTMTASFFETGFQPPQRGPLAANGRPNELIQRLITISSTALMIVDEASTLIGLSKPAELMLGYQPGELGGQLAAAVLPILDRMSYGALTGGFDISRSDLGLNGGNIDQGFSGQGLTRSTTIDPILDAA